jgi:hypothetical protein
MFRTETTVLNNTEQCLEGGRRNPVLNIDTRANHPKRCLYGSFVFASLLGPAGGAPRLNMLGGPSLPKRPGDLTNSGPTPRHAWRHKVCGLWHPGGLGNLNRPAMAGRDTPHALPNPPTRPLNNTKQCLEQRRQRPGPKGVFGRPRTYPQ